MDGISPRREPALYTNIAASLLAILVALQWNGLTADQAILIVAVIGAIGGAVTAAFTRPIAPGMFVMVVVAVADLLAGFHYDVSPDLVAAVNGLILTVFALLARVQVSPAPALAPTRGPARTTNV